MFVGSVQGDHAHEAKSRVEGLLEDRMCRIEDKLGKEDLVAALVELSRDVSWRATREGAVADFGVGQNSPETGT